MTFKFKYILDKEHVVSREQALQAFSDDTHNIYVQLDNNIINAKHGVHVAENQLINSLLLGGNSNGGA